MPNFFLQKFFQSSVAFSIDSVPLKIGFNRLVVVVASLVVSAIFLTGCGQKGDLYLTQDAPSNTKFMLYEGNKIKSNNPQKTEADKAIEQQKIEAAAAQDPQDY